MCGSLTWPRASKAVRPLPFLGGQCGGAGEAPWALGAGSAGMGGRELCTGSAWTWGGVGVCKGVLLWVCVRVCGQRRERFLSDM